MIDDSLPLIAPSLLASDAKTKEDQEIAVDLACSSGADLLHIDVMDGVFVPAKTMWNEMESYDFLPRDLPLDVHLMIHNPDDRFEEFLKIKPAMLSFHIEAAKDPLRILSKLQGSGVKAGLVLNPETSVDKILPYLPLVDFVLVMSVHPGKYGQSFIPDVLEKVVALKNESKDLFVEMDGGISLDTAPSCKNAGVDMFVVGHAFYKAENPKEVLEKIKNL